MPPVPPRIELIPWIHDDAFPVHRQVVQHISNLPTGSFLGLEITAPELRSCENQIRDSGDLLEKMYHGEYLTNAVDSTTRALLEVVFECHRKGIHIVPLEKWNVKENATLLIQDSIARERAMLENIIRVDQQLLSRRVPKWSVLTGAAHTHNVYDYLRKNKIPVVVRVKIFDYAQRDMARLVNLERRSRREGFEWENSNEKDTEKQREMRRVLDHTMGRLEPRIITRQSPLDKARRLFSEMSQWVGEHKFVFTMQDVKHVSPAVKKRAPKPPLKTPIKQARRKPRKRSR